MTSNEHGAIEQNEEHHEANNLTYYTRESELHARSYGAMNRGICTKISNTSKKKEGREVNATEIWIGEATGARGARARARGSGGRSDRRRRRWPAGPAGRASGGGRRR